MESCVLISPLLDLDALGLPSEVVTLILFIVDDARAAMRLGLASCQLLRWLDSFDEYWAYEYKAWNLDVKSFGQKLGPKKLFAMGAAALGNLGKRHSDLENCCLRVQSSVYLFRQSFMQNGSVFGVSSHYQVENYKRKLAYCSRLDLSCWPRVKIAKLNPQDEPVANFNLLGRKSAIVQESQSRPISEVHNIDLLFSGNPSFVRAPGPAPASPFWRPVLTSNGAFERIGFAAYSLPSLFVCVYDASINKWSELIVIDWSSRSFGVCFNGEYMVFHYKMDIAVVKFDKNTLKPRIVYHGVLPNAYKSAAHHYYVATAQLLLISFFQLVKSQESTASNADNKEVVGKLAKIRLDSFESRESLDVLQRDEGIITFPIHSNRSHLYTFSAYGPLAALAWRSSAVLIDLVHNKAIRQIQAGDEISSICFLDSTILVIFFAHSVSVLDLLARGPKPSPTPSATPSVRIFGWNEKYRNLREERCPLRYVPNAIRLLLGEAKGTIRGFSQGSSDIPDGANYIFKCCKDTKKGYEDAELRALGKYCSKSRLWSSRIVFLAPNEPEQFVLEENEEAALARMVPRSPEDVADYVFFTIGFDDRDPVETKQGSWTLEQALEFWNRTMYPERYYRDKY